ncbi:MAG: FABP family protein [Carbonactinosporaceae bacterium]
MQITPDLHPDLVPMAFLIGTWAGAGVGGYPTIEDFRFGQEVAFAHDGRPFLSYTSRSWLLDEVGAKVRPLATEAGYWRPRPNGEIELMLAHPTGFVEVWLGEIDGAKIELRTDAVVRTASAKKVDAGHRMYGLVEGDLLWAYDMAAQGHPLQSHLSARLKRVT